MYYLLKAVSYIPLPILYVLADFLFFVQHYIIQYRKNVVIENLKKSFPNKSPNEINKIYKEFNRNLCDYPIESIKSLSISQKALDQRMDFNNIALLHQIKERNQNVMLVCGHFFNWEWLIGMPKYIPTRNTFAVYHKIRNQAVSKAINQARERFGTETILMKDATRSIIKIPSDGNSTFLMIADQRPHSSQIHYDLEFLNQNTPVFIGFDKLAIKKNMAVVYIDIQKIKRGKYRYTLAEIIPKNKTFQPYEITHQFFERIEKSIQKDPSNWLWTHKRWKYIKGKDY